MKTINSVIHPKDVAIQRIYALKAQLKNQCLISLNAINSSVAITLVRETETPIIIDLDYTRDTTAQFNDVYKQVQEFVQINDLLVTSCDEQGSSLFSKQQQNHFEDKYAGCAL